MTDQTWIKPKVNIERLLEVMRVHPDPLVQWAAAEAQDRAVYDQLQLIGLACGHSAYMADAEPTDATPDDIQLMVRWTINRLPDAAESHEHRSSLAKLLSLPAARGESALVHLLGALGVDTSQWGEWDVDRARQDWRYLANAVGTA